MARTKASVGAKVSSTKSSKARCSVAAPTSSAGSSSGSTERARGGGGGGNSVCPRETPNWQKPITNFFINKGSSSDNQKETESPEKQKTERKRNIIISDDEDDEQTDKPTNKELDETIVLEPLDGESSHKMDEYYQKNTNKGKGKGKKSNKENLDNNISSKRDLEDIAIGEEPAQASKKVKISV